LERPDEISRCYVCVNVSCDMYGSGAILKSLREKLDGTDVEVRTIVCFGACEHAPNVVLYPKGTWYSHVQESDVQEIMANIEGGPEVERLEVGIDPKLKQLILELLDSGIE
jgi:(2Fe-2S) ferredoxin